MTGEYNTSPEESQAAVMAKGQKKGRKAIEKRNVSLQALTIEYMKIEDLKPNEYNPNRQSEHDFELLCRSMVEDGFTQPILALRDTHLIVDGEHRWRAAQTIGLEEIPVVFVDMTPEQARISTLRHNRARGTEDFELSAAVLRDLQELGAIEWAQDSLMLTDTELNRLLEDVQVTELAAEEFSTAWEPDKIQAGDVDVEGQQEGDLLRAGSTQAVTDVRERERLLKEAKSSEERDQIRQDMKIFRVSLIFSGDEAALVKGVLGDKPAESLLQICKNIAERE